MSIDLLSAIIYTANAAVCLTICIFLLCSNSTHFYTNKNDAFGKAKIYFGLSALIEAFVSTMVIIRICIGVEYLPLNKFFVPLFFYFGFCIDMTAMLIMLHSPRLNGRTLATYITPVCIIWLAHTISYITSQQTMNISPGRYDIYLDTQYSTITSWLLYAAIAVEGIIAFGYIIKQSQRFKEHIDNFFIGAKRKRSQWMIYLVLSLTLYYIVYAADFSTYNQKTDLIIMIVKSVLILLNTVAVINCRTLFWATRPAFDESLNMQRADSPAETYIERRETGCRETGEDKTRGSDEGGGESGSCEAGSNTMPEQREERSIDNIVAKWAARNDKPFLKESITIMQVAEEMNLNVRLLSKYINNVKGKNFNAWINEMKVEEVKRLIAEKPQMTMAELALEVGFTDSPAMSKVFKNIVGIPPSVFKQKLQQKQ